MAKKISATKASRIAVGSNHYKLEPAVSRTHYGEHRMTGGGQPYAFSAKRGDDAWFVVSEWSGKTHGLVQQWSDGEWTFSKIESRVQAPSWLRAQYRDTPATIHNLSSRLYSGSTPEAAIAQGLGHVAPSGTSHATRKLPSKKASSSSSTRHDVLTDADYQQAAKFDMKRFGLTLPEAMELVKDKRYPGILKTIDDWRARYGWPAANSGLTRGYVYELLGMQRSRGQ